MIYAEVLENGKIKAYESTVSDGVEFEKIKFKFPKTWDGFTKTATFVNQDKKVSIILNGESNLCTGEDECYIPYEVLKSPEFTVSLFGVSGERVATTVQAVISVKESGYAEGGEPSDPTPTEYQQLINLANETREIAQSVRTDADNGVFKGDKGDCGPQGEKGDTGAQGPQGLKGDKGDKGDTGDQGIQGVQGIQGLKGDKGEDGYTPQKGVDYFTDEDIAGLKIPVVDQTYTPESENAQSGKAVAEAIDCELHKKFELIEKIVVGYSITTAEPSDWNTNYTDYFINTGTLKEPVYAAVSGEAAPTWIAETYYKFTNELIFPAAKNCEPDGTMYNFTELYVDYYIESNADLTPTNIANRNVIYGNQYYSQGIIRLYNNLSSKGRNYRVLYKRIADNIWCVLETEYIKSSGKSEQVSISTVFSDYKIIKGVNFNQMTPNSVINIYGVRA